MYQTKTMELEMIECPKCGKGMPGAKTKKRKIWLSCLC